MIITTYESVNGGVNNLTVAQDTKSGLVATSLHGKEAAHRNLKQKIAKQAREEAYRLENQKT